MGNVENNKGTQRSVFVTPTSSKVPPPLCAKARPNHLLRHLLNGPIVQRVAFLKLSLDTGKQRSHASDNDAARWLDDDGEVFATLEYEPKKQLITQSL